MEYRGLIGMYISYEIIDIEEGHTRVVSLSLVTVFNDVRVDEKRIIFNDNDQCSRK
jgi:hypothetical protein